MTMATITADELHFPTNTAPIDPIGFRNNRLVWMMATTRGLIPLKVNESLMSVWSPMNTDVLRMALHRKEVGEAYELMFEALVNSSEPRILRTPFVWTHEQDNLHPRDVLLRLLDAMWRCPDCGAEMPCDDEGTPAEPWQCAEGHRGWDALGALYFTKSYPKEPMAYGNPSLPGDYRPRDVREAMKSKKILEVNAIAMGSTIFRKKIFDGISRPWFKTENGTNGKTRRTQDFFFCDKAKREIGARFGVHCGVQVGHLDINTNEVF